MLLPMKRPVMTASVQNSVDQILRMLQQSAGRLLPLQDSFPGNNKPQIPESGSGRIQEESFEAAEFPPLYQAQDDVHKSAPIMVVRLSNRRLYEDAQRDIVSQGILNEVVAEKLVAEFILRLGHVLQIKGVDDLTSAASIREASPLLFSVCCLQALRFFKDDELVTPDEHRQLYEEVRKILGQIVLASPLPLEELYAILIMCTFEAAPRPAYEYIESWHLSGICAQQAISTIDFAEILCNLGLGKNETRDKKCLSLWNNICLVNLRRRFAVGTGKPPTTPADLLEQCSAILNHPQATIDDGIVLAEILLFSALCNKHMPPVLDEHGHCAELADWEKRWEHLLKSKEAIYLRFGREFAYLVLAMRSLERCWSNGRSQPEAGQLIGHNIPQDSDIRSRDKTAKSTDSFYAGARKYALSMARIFLEMPTGLVQELPKFHHICIAYCSIVLSECIGEAESPNEEVTKTLSDVCTHYRRFSDELPAVMNVALEKMRTVSIRITSSLQDEQSLSSYPPKEVAGDSAGVEGDLDAEFFAHELSLMSFPTVDDFFGNWMMNTDGE
ncbi:hypothetical protein GQ53DRAFT_803321 [Thozetella sp. PMI_491]|nr:hypothetical protein GQ53DRAFT_803321 [Thozetella sp. PMI_491]